MTPEERRRVLDLRARSQRGEALRREDTAFLRKMMREHWDEYGELGAEAWNQNAAAMGSSRRLPPGERR